MTQRDRTGDTERSVYTLGTEAGASHHLVHLDAVSYTHLDVYKRQIISALVVVVAIAVEYFMGIV